MNCVRNRSFVCAFFFAASSVAMLGCGHEVPAQHFDVTLDNDGSRYQGSIDFPGYYAGGGCTEDAATSRDPEPAGTCSPSALSVGDIEGISQITSAEIDLDETTDEPKCVIQIVDSDTEKFTCWMDPRDIGHAVECTLETDGAKSAGAIATITLSPV